MKEENKSLLDNDVVISEVNIRKIGKIIALKCIKTVIERSGKDLYHLYRRLIKDMNRAKDNYTTFFGRIRYSAGSDVILMPTYGRKTR